MYNPFLSTMMLTFEAQKVIELRLVRIAWGGTEAHDEMRSMVSEKIGAAVEAAGTLMVGGSPEAVIARYREHALRDLSDRQRLFHDPKLILDRPRQFVRAENPRRYSGLEGATEPGAAPSGRGCPESSC